MGFKGVALNGAWGAAPGNFAIRYFKITRGGWAVKNAVSCL